MRGSPCVRGGSRPRALSCPARVGSLLVPRRGSRSLSQVPSGDVRRGGRAGARHRAAADRAGRRPDQPRLPVLRPPRLREDVQCTHPRPFAELRRRARRPIRAGCARPASRSRPRAPAPWTSSSSTRPAMAASTTPASCATRRSTCRPSPATGCSSSTRRTWCTSQGFNALLKIVEEPPEHLVFIFATTEPDKVLTTIRSRTHHYPFRLIPPATLRGLLERLCAEEQVTVAAGRVPAGRPGRRRIGPGLAVDPGSDAGRGRSGRGHLPGGRCPARGHRRGAARRGGRRAGGR